MAFLRHTGLYAEDGSTYLPVYYVMLFQFDSEAAETYF